MALTQTLMALVVVGGTAASMALGSQPASGIGEVRVARADIDMIVTGPVPVVRTRQATGIACNAECQNERLSYWRKRLQN